MALLSAERGATVLPNDSGKFTIRESVEDCRAGCHPKQSGETFGRRSSASKSRLFKGLRSSPYRMERLFDSVLDASHPYLEMGNLTIDVSNEKCQNTQRGQGKQFGTQAVQSMMNFWPSPTKATAAPRLCEGYEGLWWVSSC